MAIHQSQILLTGKDRTGRAFRSFDKRAEKSTRGVESLNRALRTVGAATAAYLSIGAIQQFTSAVITATATQEDAFNKLAAVGGTATAQFVQNYATQRQALTGIGDEVTLQIARISRTILGAVPDEFLTGLISRIQDISTATGEALDGVTRSISEGLAFPEKAISSWEKFGFVLSQQTKDRIRLLVSENKTLEAQLLLLDELNNHASRDSSILARNNLSGAIASVQANFGDLFEGVLDSPALRSFIEELNRVADELSSGGVVGVAQGITSTVFVALTDALQNFDAETFAEAIDTLGNILTKTISILSTATPALLALGGGVIAGQAVSGTASGVTTFFGRIRADAARAQDRVIKNVIDDYNSGKTNNARTGGRVATLQGTYDTTRESRRGGRQYAQGRRDVIRARETAAFAGARRSLRGLAGALFTTTGGVTALVTAFILLQDHIANLYNVTLGAGIEKTDSRNVDRDLGRRSRLSSGGAPNIPGGNRRDGGAQRRADIARGADIRARERAIAEDLFGEGTDFYADAKQPLVIAAEKSRAIAEAEGRLGRSLTRVEESAVLYELRINAATIAVAALSKAVENESVRRGDISVALDFYANNLDTLKAFLITEEKAHERSIAALRGAEDARLKLTAVVGEEVVVKKESINTEKDLNAERRKQLELEKRQTAELEARRQTIQQATQNLQSLNPISAAEQRLSDFDKEFAVGGAGLNERETTTALNTRDALAQSVASLKNASSLARILNTDEAGAVAYASSVGSQFGYAFSSAFYNVLTDRDADFLDDLKKGLNTIFADLALTFGELLLSQIVSATFGIKAPAGGGGGLGALLGGAIVSTLAGVASTALGNIFSGSGSVFGTGPTAGQAPANYGAGTNYPVLNSVTSAQGGGSIVVGVTPAYGAISSAQAGPALSAGLEQQEDLLQSL